MDVLTIPGKTYWRGPWTDRFGHYHEGRYVTRETYETKDVGTPGRGKKTLPEYGNVGAMTAVAQSMGYAYATEISSKDIPEFVDILVRKYGQRSAQGMLRWQINIRKNTPGQAKRWFEAADRILRVKYAGRGWD